MPDLTNKALNALSEMLEDYRKQILELESRLADCAKQKNDDTIPEAKNKLVAFWMGKKVGFDEMQFKVDQLEKVNEGMANTCEQRRLEISKLTQECDALQNSNAALIQNNDRITGERDALKNSVKRLESYAIPPTPGEIATANKNAELEKSLRESEKYLDQYKKMYLDAGNRVAEQTIQISELRKEKEHYEKVAQEMIHRNQGQVTIIKGLETRITELKKEVEEFKSNNRYHRGHSAGYDEAIGKAHEAILGIRK